jgi:hypothetical protein
MAYEADVSLRETTMSSRGRPVRRSNSDTINRFGKYSFGILYEHHFLEFQRTLNLVRSGPLRDQKLTE